MCGISGFWSLAGTVRRDGGMAAVDAMTSALAHRGPDAGGVWCDEANGLFLGHRRLSILDLSEAGRQPMVDPTARYALTFNGEIYNFADIRDDLLARGHSFRGHSDTEVLLYAIAEWGVERTVARLNGMFAFAVWDRQQRTLTLARDRAGKKPLYYGWAGRTFVFASELKGVLGHPDVRPDIDPEALGLFMQYSWVPAPFSIFKGIRQLPAATTLVVSADAPDRSPEAYWSARAVCEDAARSPYAGTEDEAADDLDRLLLDAVGLRMVSDVPLGAFLSGGIDSSLMVALMRRAGAAPLRTFSIGFTDQRYDEAPYARAIAGHLDTDHTEFYVTPADALAVVPELPTLYDEPFADPSQIPTYLVSRLTRQHVTVAISGDGGDELFCGYAGYVKELADWNRLRRIPGAMRRAAGSALIGFGRRRHRPVAAASPPLTGRVGGPMGKLIKRGMIFPATDAVDLYARKRWRCAAPSDAVIGADPAGHAAAFHTARPAVEDPLQAMMCLDFSTYLTDDVLVKVDRASMSVGLEVRCPLLDYRVVEFAWRLPMAMRIDAAGGKRILKRVLERYVPRPLFERRKRGFGVPIDTWLRHELRDWAEGLLDPSRLRSTGLLNAPLLLTCWREHLAGRNLNTSLLWNALMFQAWHERWMATPAPVARRAVGR